MLKRHIALLLSMVALFTPGTYAIAQDVLDEKNISLALASEAAMAAMQFCNEKNWFVSVVVVDRAGQLKVLLRADGAGPHTVDSSRRKAFTSASLRANTSSILDMIQKNPDAANLTSIDGFLILGGGIPIRVGDQVIGAIGVGGAPGAHLDEQCAEAGIGKIRGRLK